MHRKARCGSRRPPFPALDGAKVLSFRHFYGRRTPRSPPRRKSIEHKKQPFWSHPSPGRCLQGRASFLEGVSGRLSIEAPRDVIGASSFARFMEDGGKVSNKNNYPHCALRRAATVAPLRTRAFPEGSQNSNSGTIPRDFRLPEEGPRLPRS